VFFATTEFLVLLSERKLNKSLNGLLLLQAFTPRRCRFQCLAAWWLNRLSPKTNKNSTASVTLSYVSLHAFQLGLLKFKGPRGSPLILSTLDREREGWW